MNGMDGRELKLEKVGRQLMVSARCFMTQRSILCMAERLVFISDGVEVGVVMRSVELISSENSVPTPLTTPSLMFRL